MLTPVDVKIEDIYVPGGRRRELDSEKVEALVENLLEGADEQPIMVRRGKDRYVLINGVDLLEARKAVGDVTIAVYIVNARQH